MVAALALFVAAIDAGSAWWVETELRRHHFVHISVALLALGLSLNVFVGYSIWRWWAERRDAKIAAGRRAQQPSGRKTKEPRS